MKCLVCRAFAKGGLSGVTLFATLSLPANWGRINLSHTQATTNDDTGFQRKTIFAEEKVQVVTTWKYCACLPLRRFCLDEKNTL
jgi:hypothetical protein